jgi:predicted NBD/HSP70 family sugar kinase
VEESGSLPSEGGKPRKMLCIKPSAANAVGIHFDPFRVSIVMVDMMGNLLSSSYQDVAPDVDPEKLIAGTAKEVLSNLNKLCIPRERVLGVGAARTGPIEQSQGLAASTRRDLWVGVPIERLIEEHSGFDVVIDNDANAAAVGERWFGHDRTASEFALLYLSNGIGAGLFLANHFYRGASLKAGELAHIVVEPNGAPCHCGNRGCLEAVCSPSAIVRATHNGLAAGRPSKLAILYERDPALVDHTAVCLAAVDRDPLTRALIDRVAQYLADCAVTIANMLGLESSGFLANDPRSAIPGTAYRRPADNRCCLFVLPPDALPRPSPWPLPPDGVRRTPLRPGWRLLFGRARQPGHGGAERSCWLPP